MFNREQFKGLIHYTIAKVDDPQKLGAVKLNKVAWFVDCNVYLQTGESLTGARYVKMPQGPVPKAVVPVLAELQNEGAIRIDEVAYYGLAKKQYVSLKEPPASVIPAKFRDLVDEIIKVIADSHTAKSISAATHGAAWKLAEQNEALPFHAILADRLGEVTGDDISWALSSMGSYQAAYA